MNTQTSTQTSTPAYGQAYDSRPAYGPGGFDLGGRRLARSTDDGWIGGVCSGLAHYSGLDANLIRLLVVAATVLGFGSLVLVYVACWLLMPTE